MQLYIRKTANGWILQLPPEQNEDDDLHYHEEVYTDHEKLIARIKELTE